MTRSRQRWSLTTLCSICIALEAFPQMQPNQTYLCTHVRRRQAPGDRIFSFPFSAVGFHPGSSCSPFQDHFQIWKLSGDTKPTVTLSTSGQSAYTSQRLESMEHCARFLFPSLKQNDTYTTALARLRSCAAYRLPPKRPAYPRNLAHDSLASLLNRTTASPPS